MNPADFGKLIYDPQTGEYTITQPDGAAQTMSPQDAAWYNRRKDKPVVGPDPSEPWGLDLRGEGAPLQVETGYPSIRTERDALAARSAPPPQHVRKFAGLDMRGDPALEPEAVAAATRPLEPTEGWGMDLRGQGAGVQKFAGLDLRQPPVGMVERPTPAVAVTQGAPRFLTRTPDPSLAPDPALTPEADPSLDPTPPEPLQPPVGMVERPQSLAPPEVPGDIQAFLKQQAGGPEAPPRAVPAPTGQTDLRSAQSESAQLRLLAGLARAGSTAAQAISGAKGDPAALRALDDAADVPLENFAAQDALNQRSKGEAEKAAKLDPGSPENRRAREVLQGMLPGVEKRPGFALVTAADLPQYLQSENFRATLDLKAKEVDQRKDTADLDRTSKEQAGGLDRENRLEVARIHAAAAQSGAKNNARSNLEQRREWQLSERNVGGFEFDSERPPSADAAKKMAHLSAAKDRIMGSLQRLEALFKAKGTELGGGEVQGQMESAWIDITNVLRGLNDMGVPNGKDYVMLALQVPQLHGLDAMTTRNDTIAPKFDELRAGLERAIDGSAKAFNYRRAADNPPSVRTGPDGAPVKPGAAPAPGSKAAPGAKRPTHYAYSPNRDKRIPIYADGTQGPEERAPASGSFDL